MNYYLLLAKKAVESFIKEGKIIDCPNDLPKEFFERKAGVFVTIIKNGQVRGETGTYLPTRPTMAEEIISSAIRATTKDNCLKIIQINELNFLNYIVSILSYPQLVKDFQELDHQKFGLIIKTKPFLFPNQENVSFKNNVPYKVGFLLPQTEGINSVKEQISLACQEGKINPKKEQIFIYKFTVERHQD